MSQLISNKSISESAKFKIEYDELLQKVKNRWHGSFAEYIEISESKVSRILNSKQFDILTLLETASICGYGYNFNFNKRNINYE